LERNSNQSHLIDRFSEILESGIRSGDSIENMSTEQNYTGLAGPPMLAQQQHQTGMPHMQPTYSSAQHTQQQSQQQQNMLNAFAQAPMDAAASQLLMNPQTAAVVATVAAAAAQQMAKHQQQQQHMANQAQAMHPSPGGGPPQGVQQQQQHMAHSIPPPSGTPPVQQVGLPPHLAALLGMSHQQAQAPQNVYAAQQHCAPVAPVVSAASVPSTAMLSNMQTWKHDQLGKSNPGNSLPVYATGNFRQVHLISSPPYFSVPISHNHLNTLSQPTESHVQLLRDTNQTIPQPVAMHLADARRKEEKRSAKRVANRKSACTSRARKKALVEEMTRTNARLKRQALILALLPDLVIAITVEGEITFCSAQVRYFYRFCDGELACTYERLFLTHIFSLAHYQVERVLRHSIGDLIGANLMDLLVPASKKAIGTLMGELVAAELAAAAGTPAAAAAVPAAAKENNNENNANDASGQSSSNSSNGVAIVSDQSFPPSVVKVNSQRSSRGADNSELSTSNLSKVTPAAPASSGNSSAPQSANSSLGNDETAGIVAVKADGSTSKNGDKQQSSGDESLSSSSDANNLRQANENLNRNVRWHNAKFMSKSSAAKAESTHKDDVMGQGVTPNNASARLSSLQHRPEMLAEKRKAERAAAAAAEEEENSSNSSDSLLAGVEEKKKTPGKNGNGNSSDESGYRESNESAREGEDDTESSTSDSSSGGKF
jgi:hypothetical protein